MEKLLQPQQFPVFLPASAPFLDADGNPSGARGATARVQIEVNLRPQWLTAIRMLNVYEVPSLYQNADVDYLRFLDGFQTMTTELTLQNIVTRDAVVPLVMGRDGVHWHTFPTPYPWRGGNNIAMVFRRLIAYPAGLLPTAHVVLEGIQEVDTINGTP